MTVSQWVKLFSFRRIRIVIAGRQRQCNSPCCVCDFQNRPLKSTGKTIVLKVEAYCFQESVSATVKKNILRFQRKTLKEVWHVVFARTIDEKVKKKRKSSVLNPGWTLDSSGGAIEMPVPSLYPRSIESESLRVVTGHWYLKQNRTEQNRTKKQKTKLPGFF